MVADLADDAKPLVVAEHPVRVGAASCRRGFDLDRAADGKGSTRATLVRIDLMFRWPTGSEGRSHVVVVEAKLGSTVGAGQLAPYRQEARRLAKGGPVSCVLLTLRPDVAERRHTAWTPVRWPTLMGRWEHRLATMMLSSAAFAPPSGAMSFTDRCHGSMRPTR